MATPPNSRMQLFCRHSTIRGVPKIINSKHRFLRSMWFLFVITMFLLLNVSAIRIVLNYLDYDVTIQTKLLPGKPHGFPAMTICNHNPFSRRATGLWDAGVYPSPTDYNKWLRNITKKNILKRKYQDAQTIQSYDAIHMYYQNLASEASDKLSHTAREMISHCMVMVGDTTTIGDHKDCGIQVHRVSHPRHFNCYTLMPKKNDSNFVAAVYLIIDLGKPPNPSIYQQAFFMDVFEQAYGLRIQIHEAGILPDMERESMHIEPGKMVEISYSTTEWQMFDSPKQHCHVDKSVLPIMDMGERYNYTRDSCIEQVIGDYIREQCSCILARKPRRKAPEMWDPPLPYCGNIDRQNVSAFFKRLDCVQHLDLGQVRRKAFETTCLPLCVEHKYPNHFSVTQWRSSEWQLHWLLNQSDAWTQLRESVNSSKETAKFNAALDSIMHFVDSPNLTFPANESNYIADPIGYAFIVLRRSNFDLIAKKEKLNLSLEALLSRIGGLCSLCLGLTCAFIFELIEFCYLSCKHRNKDKRGLPTLTVDENVDLKTAKS